MTKIDNEYKLITDNERDLETFVTMLHQQKSTFRKFVIQFTGETISIPALLSLDYYTTYSIVNINGSLVMEFYSKPLSV